MEKAANLSDLNKGQTVMARRLGMSTSESENCIRCPRAAVASTYEKRVNDGQTVRAPRRGVGRSGLTKECGRGRLSRLVGRSRRLPVAQLTAEYNAGPSAGVSEHRARRRTLLDSVLYSRRPLHV
ncbi:unnamed protein product, partial [Ixodes hexagonus]